jgi:hypothetical protein
MSEAFEIQQAEAPASASAPRRKSAVSLIVLHDDARSAEAAAAAYTAKGAKSAPHYYVAETGAITQFVRESRAARHSGTATWNKRRRNIDRISIGVTLEHAGGRPHPDAQLIALHRLLDELQQRYKLTDAAIVGWTPSDQPGAGTVANVVPPPPPMEAPEIPIGPMVLGEEAPDYGLWAFLQGETYRQRGGGLKYIVNDLAHSQAFPVYALKFGLGAPVGPNQPPPVVVNGATYNYQPFARATIFNEGRNYSAVQNLNDQLNEVIPDSGVSRALLEASYAAGIAESKRHVAIQGREEFREDWRFHAVAMRSKLGPALGGNYATADQIYAVQVFAGDTLYTPRTEQSGCRFLSQTESSDPAYAPIWVETYKICGAPYDANSPFQQRAAQDRIGSPLTGVYVAQYGGANYQVQVFGLDTLYAGPDGAIKRMSELPKPPDIMAWNPAPATPPPQPPPPAQPVALPVVTPVRDTNWPPFPNFKPLPNRAKRDEAFGHFEYTRGAGRSINIQGGWVQANIIEIVIPQLAKLWRGGKVQVHRRVADQLKAMWAAWEAAGLLHLVLTYGGDFVPRVMAGNSGEISMHSYGSAFDINVNWNQYNVRAALVGDKGSVRELVPIANQHGFYWGGHFRYNRHTDQSDGMHFEWARPI